MRAGGIYSQGVMSRESTVGNLARFRVACCSDIVHAGDCATGTQRTEIQYRNIKYCQCNESNTTILSSKRQDTGQSMHWSMTMAGPQNGVQI